jgi:thiol-disulfide isomerase/thioredoxin
MHPALTWSLVSLAVAAFFAAWWVEGRPDGHRLASWRRFTLVVQAAAVAMTLLVLRPGHGTHDSPAAFAAAIGNGTPALIDVYGNWCGPCLLARPSVDALERATRGRMAVVRVDIEAPAARLVVSRYGLRATPTYVLVDGQGTEVWRQVGGSPDRAAIEQGLAAMGSRR